MRHLSFGIEHTDTWLEVDREWRRMFIVAQFLSN